MKAWIEIDLEAWTDNVRAVQGALPADVEPILVVKADAYGHGAGALVAQACKLGVRWFAVAYPEEAFAIRHAAPAADILILGVVEPDRAGELAAAKITPIVTDLEHGLLLAKAARTCGCVLPVHVKVDTGMGRLGLAWQEAVAGVARLVNEKNLEVRGLCSHFAMVEASEPQAAGSQAARFREVAMASEAQLGRRLFKHISSSRALLMHPEWDLNGVRPGIIAYGYGADEEGLRCLTRPVLQWKTRVVQVKSVPANFPVGYYSTYVTSRPTEIGILACGYADGYLRTLSNRGQVLIGGQRRPVVGRVSMNWITVDLGPASGIERGAEAVLIGRQGAEQIWANELAAVCRTIPYEILVGIGRHLERRLRIGDNCRTPIDFRNTNDYDI